MRGKETFVTGLILEMNWEEAPPRGPPPYISLPFNIPFLTEKVPFLHNLY